MNRVDRNRRSAKDVIYAMAAEIMARPKSMENDAKLTLIETIASRMSWMDLFNKIRYRSRNEFQTSSRAHAEIHGIPTEEDFNGND